jgi:hypothetical protein
VLEKLREHLELITAEMVFDETSQNIGEKLVDRSKVGIMLSITAEHGAWL